MAGDSTDRAIPVADPETTREEYEAIFETVSDALFLLHVDEAGTIRFQRFNEREEEFTGKSTEEVRGKTPVEVFGEDPGREIRANYRECLEREETITYEEEVRIDGEPTAWRTTLTPIFEGGQVRRIVGSSREITERKQRERALEQLHDVTRDLMRAATVEEVATIACETATLVLEQSMNGIHVYDEDADALVPVAWADDSERALGGEPPALPVEDSLAGQVYQRGDPESYGDLGEVDDRFSAGTPFRSELILPLGDHGVFIFSSTTVGTFDDVERALAQVLAANVETALDRVEQRQQLERQNERLEEFASVVSHDLRNPLNVAEGRLALAQDECDSQHLDDVARAHGRIQTLVDDLLTLAREGKEVGDREPIELGSFVGSCWRNVEADRGTIDATVDRTISADRSRLQQLLENLFRNAVEHGGPDVTVEVGTLEDGFFVEDDGPGIPSDARDEVFDVGYSTADDGNGFGLSIVRRIATAHGWDISVTEGTDGGARFEITDVSFVE